MSSPALTTEGLAKTYRTRFGAAFEAVSDLDLAIPRGTVFGLLGPNGAGKTTTIMMVLGVLRPTRGRFSLFGAPMGEVAVRSRIGYLPEKFQLPAHLRPEEFLRFQGWLHGLSGTELERRIDPLLKQLGLFDRRTSPIGGFSKGMQQRLALAQALVNDPDLVILDEPTSALDPLGRRDVREIVESLRDRGKTVLLNSHILSDVERVCSGVAILRKGKLERQGTIASLVDGAVELTMRIGGLTPDLEAALTTFGNDLRVNAIDGIAEVKLGIPDEEVIPAVAEAVHARGGRLYALAPSRETLEELFVRVVGEIG